MHKEKRINLIF